MNQPQMMVQNTIVSNTATIINEFQSLHSRQLNMLALLETEFLKAIPEKILDLNVDEFLNKYHGDFNQAYSQLLKKDDFHNISQESSQASTIGINGISQNHNNKPQPFLSGTIPHALQYGNVNNKSILKTSKRKRNNQNEFDKKYIQSSNDHNNNNINGTFHNGNHYYTHNYYNKENSNDINNQEKQYPLQSNKNTAKKTQQHKEQHQQQQQLQHSQAAWQSSVSKSGKKVWKF